MKFIEICFSACGDDYIGRDCTGTCSSSGPEDGPKTCKGVLICLPDPYGCSCGSGFKGLNCSEGIPAFPSNKILWHILFVHVCFLTECALGTYGAGCTQTRDCHCQNTTYCGTATGHCGHQPCQNGWISRPFCDTSKLRVYSEFFVLIIFARTYRRTCKKEYRDNILKNFLKNINVISKESSCSIPL